MAMLDTNRALMAPHVYRLKISLRLILSAAAEQLAVCRRCQSRIIYCLVAGYRMISFDGRLRILLEALPPRHTPPPPVAAAEHKKGANNSLLHAVDETFYNTVFHTAVVENAYY